jgi:hypothetical protein
MKRTFFIWALILVSSLLFAQEPKISARTDSTQYKIGQWVLLHVDAQLPQGVDSLVPVPRDSVGPFEILAIEPGQRANGRQQWTFRLTMFDTGNVFIPPLAFIYRSKTDTAFRVAYSNPLPLSIVSIPIDVKGDIKDIKPPLNAPWKLEDFLPYLIALAVLLLAGLAYYYYRKKKKEREAALLPPKPTVPPGQAALAALRIVEDGHLWQQGKVKQYYSEVTEIVRRFFEDQFGLLALESTSDEILDQLHRVPEAAPLQAQCRSFLTTADLVKFAKYQPAPEEHERELRAAYEIVRTLMPKPSPEPEVQEVENVR